MSSADTTWSVRRAEATDLPTLVRFNRALAQESEGLDLPQAQVEEGVRRGLQQPDACCYFVVEQAGAVVGQLMLTFEWSDWRAGFFWWIQSVYVEESSRGRGIFRALYAHVQRLAREESSTCCGLRLYVEHGNTHAMRVYEDVGMSRTLYHMYEVDWT